MSNSDELVNRWFLHEWTDPESYRIMYPKYDPTKHGTVDQLEVITTDADWECGCYSSWTRDDQQVLKAEVSTKGGNVTVSYGTWGDFPDFIMSILDFGDLKDSCGVERRLNDEDDPW